jgi:hypothetical protein
MSVLMAALGRGTSPEVVKLLLDYDADITAVDEVPDSSLLL